MFKFISVCYLYEGDPPDLLEDTANLYDAVYFSQWVPHKEVSGGNLVLALCRRYLEYVEVV
jgi:hypothetical protein